MAPKTQVLTLAKHSPGLNDGPDSSQAGSLCSICSHSSIVLKKIVKKVHVGFSKNNSLHPRSIRGPDSGLSGRD